MNKTYISKKNRKEGYFSIAFEHCLLETLLLRVSSRLWFEIEHLRNHVPSKETHEAYSHWENYISISFHIEWNMIAWWQFSFQFLTKWNSIWFRKSKEKLSPRSYPIQCERKLKYSFLSVERLPDRKTVTDRLIAVRETVVPRYQRGPIEGPLKPPVHHSTIILRGLRG